MKKVELLSPAGDYNCFLAAINAGADAVYLSGEKFGARAYAKNFSKEELLSAIDYAHIFGKKVFLTVNTLLKNSEIEELYDYLLPFYIQGLDGVIVQDMGVISYIKEHFPELPVHASTQLTITGLEGIRLLEKLGIKRTVLAREVSLDEIKHIITNSDMEIECFIHGALCYSYSGKCLFSSLVGGRSGNRGRCAGSCRQPYNGKYLLSTKDICCLPIIPDLIDSGICSFKIEGRMKSKEYVAFVTAIYRKYIDFYYDNMNKLSIADIKKTFFSGRDFDNDLNHLLKMYTRGGNSTGYYFKHNAKEMITIDDASYKSDKGSLKDSVNDEYIKVNNKIKIKGLISIHPGINMSLLINDSLYTEGALVSLATNRPLDKETVKKQLLKTGDTEFEFKELSFDMSDDAFVRVSDINDLRRKALNLLKDELTAKYKRRISDSNTSILYNSNKSVDMSYENNKIPELICQVSNKEQLDILVCKKGIDKLYIPLEILRDNISIIDEVKKSGKEVYIILDSVIRYNYLERNSSFIKECLNKSDGVLVDSHEAIEFVKSIPDYNKEIIGDIHIYALNNNALDAYKKMGISKFTLPVELNKKELYTNYKYNDEVIAYGYLPMMISAQCVNKTTEKCDQKSKCITLTDLKGVKFYSINKCFECSNVIYNSVPLSLHGEVDFIKKISPSGIRLVFTIEDSKRVNEITDLYIDLMNNKSVNTQKVFKENSFTKGHLNRGVL